ncbi:MAG: LamG-like jellyroll fold domain-containing protein [Promethearchaeota archaeon]
MFQKILDKLKEQETPNLKVEKELEKPVQKPEVKSKATIEIDKQEGETEPTLLVENEKEMSILEKNVSKYEDIEDLNYLNKKEVIKISEEKEGIPLIKFESNASAPILRYDIPSPSSYEGRCYIELKDLKLDGKNLPFNNKAMDKLTAKEFLETNRENIFKYLATSTKIDLERDFYLVFDLDEIKAEELVVQYPGTFSFLDDTLEEWDIVKSEGSIVQVMERKRNHTKVLLVQGTPSATISNRFEERSSGSIELWVEFANLHPTEWANHIRLIHRDKLSQGYLYSLNNNLYWYTKNASNQNVVQLVATNITYTWIHLKMTWNGNKVYIFVNGVHKLTTTFFPGCNKVDGLLIASGHNQEIWIDAVGYSWDPNYKIGDNLVEQEIVVSRQDIRNEILSSIDRIEPGVSNLLNAIKGVDETQLREKYQLFKYFIQIAMEMYNRMPIFYKTMGGQLKLKWVHYPQIRPRLMFVETYKLTSFPGDYGAGTTIKTFSLLPKEETEISIKTWKKSIKTSKEASSILDSYTEEKADEFENNVQNENSNTSRVEESNSYHAEVGGGVSWGAVSVSASAGTEGGSSSAREEFAKNVMNATTKHSQTASAKRDVNVETSFERTEETGEEVTIMRRIENLNASRTLNFTFRQMNQQFHSLLHVVDVRIAFYNGCPGSMKEFALYELGDLIEEYLTPGIVYTEEEGENDELITIDLETTLAPEFVEENLRQYIMKEYSQVFDFQGTPHTFLGEITLNTAGGATTKYLRVIPPSETEEVRDGKNVIVRIGQQEYKMRGKKEDEQGNIIQQEDVRYLEGIITGRKVLTMKTDGIIIEALLGQANALDNFSLNARKEKIREESLKNELIEADVAKNKTGIKLINALIANNQFDKAITAYKEIFGMQEGLKYFGEIFNHPNVELTKKTI